MLRRGVLGSADDVQVFSAPALHSRLHETASVLRYELKRLHDHPFSPRCRPAEVACQAEVGISVTLDILFAPTPMIGKRSVAQDGQEIIAPENCR
jgi:hypothetical protein